MGHKVAHTQVERGCDEILDLGRARPVPIAVPFVLAAPADTLDFPIQRVEGFETIVIFISATGLFEIEEFARQSVFRGGVRFGRVGAAVGSVASVDDLGAAIQVVSARRNTFGEEEFYRIRNTAVAGAVTVTIASFRGVVIG